MNRRLSNVRFTFLTVVASSFAFGACSDGTSEGGTAERAAQLRSALSSPASTASEKATVVLSSLSSQSRSKPARNTLPRPVAPARPLAPKRTRSATPSTAPAVTAAPAAAPTTTFEGEGDTGWAPPDTNGAVSSQFVVSTVNNRITVRNRSGATLTSTDLNDFWSKLPTTASSFDTRVRFDPYAQRFIVISAGSLGDTPNSGLLIAVSATNDPTGSWFQFRVKADPTSQAWLDHPTVGFNSKWVVVSGNMVGAGTTVWVFDKSALYAGNLSYRALPGVGWTTQPAETYDPTLPDLYMLHKLDDDSGVTLYKVTGAVGSETIQTVGNVTAPQSWFGAPQAPERDSTQLVDTGEDWLLDAVYRNGSIWATDVVQPTTGPSRSAVQWWRVSTTGTLQDFGRIDDPTGTAYYGMSSIAVNAHDDALIGFTRFSADTYPSAAYAYRLSADAPGTFRSPYVYQAGTGPYSAERWGDYSHTQVDPTNDVDIWTVQEYSRGANGWDTWWAEVTPSSSACSSDSDCDNHVFCDGAEHCASGTCAAGVSWGDACVNATPLPRYQNSGFLGTGERWFVVTDEPAGWQASNVHDRQIRVNGVLVSPGQMPLPPKVDGKRYFQFTAGSADYASWSLW